ncbi:MAG: T9SS type A sorting domain-containing protein, partial [Bacteroidota bacterium]
TGSLSYAPTRCGFEVPFWLTYTNTGNTYVDGRLIFGIDPFTSLVSATPAVDELSSPFQLFWDIEDIPPFQSQSFYVVLQMPGVDFIGTNLSFKYSAYTIDEEDTLNLEDEELYYSLLSCAYDPNDKLVTPAGIEEEHYTLFGEELTYTVRFQNTGTDTAFTVRITDYLDTNLDWSTFRPLDASHSFTTNLSGDGLVEFVFEDILLVDSLTNEPGSHGFVKYRIQPKNNLEEFTVINNTADIFFDFNPPIRTNTTFNTYVSSFPTPTNNLTETIKINVHPNPFGQVCFISTEEEELYSDTQLEVYNLQGSLIYQQQLSGNFHTLDASSWPKGIYLLKVYGDNKQTYWERIIRQ